ncbi:MAG: hypothetical protein SynsKO_22680 [Synoicihabitans sp.]
MEASTPLEAILDSARKEEMVKFLQDHPETFSEALDLAASDRPRYAWRAAWLLWSCIEPNDDRIKGSIDRLIAAMPGKPDGHWRELMRIVSGMQLNDEQEGRLFEMAVKQWLEIDKQPSVRWMAFRFMADMVQKYPELAGEVKLVLRPNLVDPLSGGIRRLVTREAKKIHAIKSSFDDEF